MNSDQQMVLQLIDKARAAQLDYERNGSQKIYRMAAKAAAWALMEPERNQAFSKIAVTDTTLGNVDDKITKNYRKTLGVLRDLENATSYGVTERNTEKGLTKIARAKGVIGAIVPSTNPVATPTNNIVNALFCGNAIILAPSPKGQDVCEALIAAVHHELDKIGVSRDLVQMLTQPASKVKTQTLMENVDLVIVTGSQDNVRRAYTSGTPALGVGAGNVPVIIDETADYIAAAQKIVASKSFDNATSCSSENALIIVDAAFDDMIAALAAEGIYRLNEQDAETLKEALFLDGGLNRDLIAKDAPTILERLGIELENVNVTPTVLLVDGQGIGKGFPESGEKLSPVSALYRAGDFDHALVMTAQILDYVGAGHSIGLHSQKTERAEFIAQNLPTSRVIVNQPHAFATGGAFNNGLPFSLSMGCGSWGGNSIDNNLHYIHYMNTSVVAVPIEGEEPPLESLMGDYWQEVGR
uniref:Aldehyde dehydrogenase n=1 Tax=uncultured Thiotrichaceae bacterium TaxID=298394 RepID=A0A6S6UFI9_9GAMM|nr:MAG: Aldehyde dehydrogenase [uncultured Thiotrichaceae bacterium]